MQADPASNSQPESANGALITPPIDWWKSRAVWGAIVAIVAGLLRKYDVEIYGLEEELATGLWEIAVIVGGLVAAEGRISAKRRIGTAGNAETLKAGNGVSRSAEQGTTVTDRRYSGLLLLAALFLTGFAGYRFTGSLSAGYQGQTVTLTSDGKTINTDVRLADSRGYAK